MKKLSFVAAIVAVICLGGCTLNGTPFHVQVSGVGDVGISFGGAITTPTPTAPIPQAAVGVQATAPLVPPQLAK